MTQKKQSQPRPQLALIDKQAVLDAYLDFAKDGSIPEERHAEFESRHMIIAQGIIHSPEASLQTLHNTCSKHFPGTNRVFQAGILAGIAICFSASQEVQE